VELAEIISVEVEIVELAEIIFVEDEFASDPGVGVDVLFEPVESCVVGTVVSVEETGEVGGVAGGVFKFEAVES